MALSFASNAAASSCTASKNEPTSCTPSSSSSFSSSSSLIAGVCVTGTSLPTEAHEASICSYALASRRSRVNAAA
eukprot:CAMPEP_0182536150 /NCGR_PEP_ID=MMETSP1323-20130603/19433_1 /TAXON_ID=236787 /ORGANISM="Florenciella parvula, Strain RCC1693" /LENGTH=74 /DNA_ID=CAMNT_0024746355 /DNA_START=13 /DNA_END=233 /DNA_ORIENTATION=+